jgi:hypothetical protein
MRPSIFAAFPAVLFTLGCMVVPSDRSAYALDYHLDRPRVLAIAIDPPVLVHGQPVTVRALALGPDGIEADTMSYDVCGLATDRVVEVREHDCFHQPELVTHLGDGAEASWEPPDLSDLVCPFPADTGLGLDSGSEDPPDPDPDQDTDLNPYYAFDCGSFAPLLVTARFGDEQAFASADLPVRLQPYEEGEYVPPGRWSAERSLTWTGDAVAGGEIDLTFTLAAESPRFSWFVDAGELAGTGWTSDHEPVPLNDLSVTHNTLRIPDDWHGPLRVVAVAVDNYTTWGVAGDSAWSVVTLEVP